MNKTRKEYRMGKNTIQCANKSAKTLPKRNKIPKVENYINKTCKECRMGKNTMR